MALPNENPQSLGTFAYNLRFPGQLYDSHTGLNYNYFRDYDAVTGRYAQSDPIGLEGGLNTYVYVNANPLRYTDPLGLELGAAYAAINRGERFGGSVVTPFVLNFSIGAGGMGMFGPLSASADSGIAVDTKGNVCVYSTVCGGVGFQTPLAGALGLVGGVGTGELCSGQSDSGGVFWMGGKGIVGEGEVLIGPDGSSLTRGLVGVGWAVENPAGLGSKACHTTLICN
jgi:RHS repeat-associated protein